MSASLFLSTAAASAASASNAHGGNAANPPATAAVAFKKLRRDDLIMLGFPRDLKNSPAFRKSEAVEPL
jgi:hypothetical protein